MTEAMEGLLKRSGFERSETALSIRAIRAFCDEVEKRVRLEEQSYLPEAHQRVFKKLKRELLGTAKS